MKYVREHNINPCYVNDDGDNLLHKLCIRYTDENMPDIIDFCLENYPETFIQNKTLHNPIHFLCKFYRHDNLEDILWKIFMKMEKVFFDEFINQRTINNLTYIEHLLMNEYQRHAMPKICRFLRQHGLALTLAELPGETDIIDALIYYYSKSQKNDKL